MGRFLDTRGKSILSPAICDRCRLIGAAADMIMDPDKPGLFVHMECADQYDPWKLAPRSPEDVTVPHPREDVPLTLISRTSPFVTPVAAVSYAPSESFDFTRGTLSGPGPAAIGVTRAGTATQFQSVDKYIDSSFQNVITTASRPEYTPATNELEITMKLRFVFSPPDGEELLDLMFGGPGLMSYGIATQSGRLRLRYSTDGTTFVGVNSTVNIPLAANTVGYIKAQWRGNDGAGHINIRFWTSTDGVNWTQLGTTIVTPGAVSMFHPSTIAPTSGTGAYYLYWMEVRDKYAGGGNLCLRFDAADGLPGQYSFKSSYNNAVWSMSYPAVVGAELAVVAADTGRLDYNPVTLACKGLLIEEPRTNLLLYSEDLTNPAWAKFNCTIHAVAHPIPTGAATLSILQEDVAVGTSHYTAQSIAKAATPITYTLSAYARRANTTVAQIGRQWQQLWATSDSGGNNRVGCAFDVVNGVAGTPFAQNGFTVLGVTITPVNFQYYRCTVSFTSDSAASLFAFLMLAVGPNASDVFFNGTGAKATQFTCMQLEPGALATSYIPTLGAPVTRNLDVPSIASLGGWYNAAEGTLVTEVDGAIASGVSNAIVALFDDGTLTDANNIGVRIESSGAPSFRVRTGGVTQAFFASGAGYVNGAVLRQASAYKLNDFVQSPNGGAVANATSGTVPTVSKLYLGTDGGQALNGHLRRLSYYPTRVPDDKLRSLSA